MSVTDTWNMACPACGEDESLDVTVTLHVRLTADGTDADASGDGSHEWDEDSECSCHACGWGGKAWQANIDNHVKVQTYTVIIGADVRGYHEMSVEAKSPEAARAYALEQLRQNGDYAASSWTWELESVQGDVSIKATSDDNPDAEFSDVPAWNGPRYNVLEALVRRLAEIPTADPATCLALVNDARNALELPPVPEVEKKTIIVSVDEETGVHSVAGLPEGYQIEARRYPIEDEWKEHRHLSDEKKAEAGLTNDGAGGWYFASIVTNS